jgi:hypothetical protein
MTRARKNYRPPETWGDIFRIKQEMQIDLLKRAQIGARDAGVAAKNIGMTRNSYVITCRRLGVEVDHLLDRRHPRWGARMAAA